MATSSGGDISRDLLAWSQGDQNALNRLISAVYPELRRIARQHLGRGQDSLLESAAVANEAYLRLLHAREIQCESRVRFLALCAQIIRHVLVDHARSHLYAKRGGDVRSVRLDEAFLEAPAREPAVLALDEALDSLAKIDPRKSRVVELRYFGGLSVEESAEALQVSPETVMRDWRMAKAWLFRELSEKPEPANR